MQFAREVYTTCYLHGMLFALCRKLEVYEGDSRVWKENAEWNGTGCCRAMVPIEHSGESAAQSSTAATAAQTEQQAPVAAAAATHSASEPHSHSHEHCRHHAHAS
jgi:hypothetical protein